MAFRFFKDKPSGPIEVICPLCTHRQQESPLAVSSYCKGCGAYLSFQDGEISARAKEPTNPFADRPEQPKVEVDYGPRKSIENPIVRETTAAAKPKEEQKPIPVEEQPVVVAETLKTVVPEPELSQPEITEDQSSSQLPESPLTAWKSLKSKKSADQREAKCFDCGDTHLANALANSTQCHKCGRMISLQNHEIRSAWQSAIKTRGDVFIYKKGLVTAPKIECHNLIVEGDFTGSTECTGDLILRRNGRVVGKVMCRRLLVERRAKIEFLNTVEMGECKIDGTVTGNIHCHGKLSLEKRATLTGNIKVGSLTVADGAKHNGQIQMV